ncbi:Vitamin B12 import ATP-binding protein BtuD [bioreactor metagenome]|uniref:Vitamin B12 import ATP-binding protein BtuD n=1 Tax=bioreactor metagenome TaxID=1076179 RepID=A0A644YKI5_9ZZZZ
MKILTGCLAATEGEVRIAGHDIFEEAQEAKKHIGYLPEVPPLYMDMTVAEQLEFACELRGLRIKKSLLRAYIDNLCARTQVSDTRDRLIRNLSKGYRQRVAVTQLLVGDPEILILDEPTVGLDPRQIREFRALLSGLSREHTIILSSHILSEISSICDRILVFYEGMLIADGHPQQLQEQLSNCRVLEVEIRGDAEGIVSLLRNLPDVLTVKEQGSGFYQVSHRVSTDIRSALYRTLRPTEYELMMMKPEEISLESLYLRITENEQETTK